MRSEIKKILNQYGHYHDIMSDELLDLFEKMCNEERSLVVKQYHHELMLNYLEHGTNSVIEDAKRLSQIPPQALKTKLGESNE